MQNSLKKFNFCLDFWGRKPNKRTKRVKQKEVKNRGVQKSNLP